MCGRYAATRNQSQLVEVFEVDEVVGAPRPEPWAQPHFNVAPTDPVPAVFERVDKSSGDVVRKLAGLRWGLVPSWSKGPGTGPPMINARLETVTEKPSFKRAMAARRCVLPADGYYEWYPITGTKRKQPFYIHPMSGLMLMAGLYEYWRDPVKDPDSDDAWVVSCTIITTQASDDLGHIHDRMPVQVRPDQLDAWLDPATSDADAARELVHVPEAGEMTAHAVSTLVNSVRNDSPELIEPIPEEQP